MHVFLQVTSLVGAALVLAAYVALQRRWWSSTGATYLWFNFVGAALLTAVAIVDRRAGFVVLEATWTLVSLATIVRPASGPVPRV
jgi:drug/metabolite transporter (DMT)-like permease